MLYIFTLTYNGRNNLLKLNNSLLPALKNIDYVWLIKDNNSSDDTADLVKSWEDKATLISYKNNSQNFSQGNNLLFSEAKPKDEDFILLLNNDIVFNDKESIKNMINMMNNDSQIGALGARLLYSNTNNLQHAGVVFHDKSKLPSHFRLNQKSDDNAKKNRYFQVVTGAVLLTKSIYYKNVFKNKSGNNGMDENYHWAFDDVDLCLSIKYNMDKKIVYYGGSNIYHEDSASLKKAPKNRLFLNHNSNYLKDKWKDKYMFDAFIYYQDPDFNLYTK